MARPLLFLDVDGPLIPFGSPQGHPSYGPLPGDAPGDNPLLARIDPMLGPQLAALPYTLVWATSWEEDANAYVSPRLGLPPLPLVPWPELPTTVPGLHWKTRPLAAWAAGRPFAWLDDELGAADRAWLAAHYPGPTLLLRVDPTVGLSAEHFLTLRHWVSKLGG